MAGEGRAPYRVRVPGPTALLPPAPVPRRLRPSPREWRALAGMGGFVLLLHVLGWGSLLLVVVPQHHEVGGQLVFGVGLGVTAYVLGMRHAFDADHIAAIDNTTRALQGRRDRPLGVGFWFALGHSSLVFLLCALLALGVRVFVPGGAGGSFRETATVVGLSVSAVFLVVVGVLNLAVLMGIVRAHRSGGGEQAMEAQLARRGLLTRVLGRVTRSVRRPRQMVVVGMLFGLGFDTATEVALLVLAGGAASLALPWYAIMTLPVLFAAGMCLMDTVDGVAMSFAYGWADATPRRRFTYNLSITSLSVVVALGIGGVQVAALLSEASGITGGPVGWLAGLDLNLVGFGIVGAFAVAGAAAALLSWALGRRTRTA